MCSYRQSHKTIDTIIYQYYILISFRNIFSTNFMRRYHFGANICERIINYMTYFTTLLQSTPTSYRVDVRMTAEGRLRENSKRIYRDLISILCRNLPCEADKSHTQLKEDRVVRKRRRDTNRALSEYKYTALTVHYSARCG